MPDEDDAYPKPGEIRRLDERPAFQRKHDDDDIPSRANVPKLSAHPALRHNNDEDDRDLCPDEERIKKIVDNPASQQEEPDIAKEHIAFLDKAIILAAPPDLFGSQKNPNAWFSLQSSESRNKLAEILFWIVNNQDHPLKIDISSRHKKVMELIKERYNDAECLQRISKRY